jgi:hypothetical protein
MTPKSIGNEAKNNPGAVPEPTDSPDEPKGPQKVAVRVHRQPRRAKGTRNDDTRKPKRRQRLQKDAKRSPRASKKTLKMMKKHEKERQVKTCFFSISKNLKKT